MLHSRLRVGRICSGRISTVTFPAPNLPSSIRNAFNCIPTARAYTTLQAKAPVVTINRIRNPLQMSSAQTPSGDANGFYTPVFPSIMLTPLQEMGFGLNRCVRALHATGGSSVDRATEWLFEHSEDADIDTPLLIPRPAAASSAATDANAASAAASSAAPSSSLSYDSSTPMKLVLLVRQDLGMRTGKIAAQCSHAAVGTVLELQQSSRAEWKQFLRRWLSQGQAKVVLSIKDESEMDALAATASKAGLPTEIIHDAGRTQVEPNTKTVLAIGPGPIPLIDSVTGHLKLL